MMEHSDSYESALKALHSLQSNAEYLNLSTRKNWNNSYKLYDTEKYLLRTAITLEKLDTLSVIHVAGTKGKGSSCAYAEAILREHGYSTGFYSSPHLVTIRERIKINGQPISESLFTEYFWKIYKKLKDAKEHEFDMPTYFNFLTILMFNIFLDLNIDVAVIEVGIGGLKDCTNIVRNPVCVGITSLALDHTSLLGTTLEDIAYQKSGIFKPNTIAFSVPQHPRAMEVLEKRAVEENCTLHVVPPFEDYKWENLSPILKIRNSVQQQNASLAIQMATAWITSKTNKRSSVTHNILNTSECINRHMDKIATGLSSCKWAGRMQILETTVASFYLDGAHTIESIQCCISWFNNVTSGSGKKNILIFNVSGKRDSKSLLTLIKSLQFEKAYFVPNYAGIKTVDDEANHYLSIESQVQCSKNAEFWGAGSVVANTVSEVLQEIKKDNLKLQFNYNDDEKYQVLVTGSLHLVGAVLAILDPNLTMTTQF
ncbi:folylpolyglutamate synthase 1 isoform X2 [Nomia melanderi]|uniref:folylpolyglutamate synthase 1 isoform X2 n=1 Tax=Nomia melanderi TaxID=2448451 RepID=UPI0013041C83|nr:folylpolyglutamate synthase, mitochondrial isoform X2 [Nomia melanderi]